MSTAGLWSRTGNQCAIPPCLHTYNGLSGNAPLLQKRSNYLLVTLRGTPLKPPRDAFMLASIVVKEQGRSRG